MEARLNTKTCTACHPHSDAMAGFNLLQEIKVMANQSPILPIIAGNPDHAALIKTHAVLRLSQISSVSRIKHSTLSPTDERIHLHFTIRMANADEYTVSLKAVSKANHTAATEFLNDVRWKLVTLSICGFDVENVALIGGFFGVEPEPVAVIGLSHKKVIDSLNLMDFGFSNPARQTPYSKLVFNSGTKDQARQVVVAFSQAFADGSALIPAVWALGASLKSFTGFWPHLQLTAEGAAGKSTLMEKMAHAFQLRIFNSDALKTDYKRQLMVSNTIHPVILEDIGTDKAKIVKKASKKLKKSYKYSHETLGDVSYLSSAPVMLLGEYVDVSQLRGKMVRTSLSVSNQGIEIPSDLPVFPMREWLEFLAGLDQEQVENDFNRIIKYVKVMIPIHECGPKTDRIVSNFAAIFLAWEYLYGFAGMDRKEYGISVHRKIEDNILRELAVFLGVAA